MRLIKIMARVATLTVCLAFSTQIHAQLSTGSGPISGYHGNSATCNSCHAAGAYTATSSLSGPTSVLHGQNSTTFTLNGTGGVRRGFNIAIYRVSGDVKQTTGYNTLGAGIYTPFSGGELQSGVAQTATSWTFRWTAPATLGTYRVYACVNPVNNNGADSGDGNSSCTTRDFSVTNNNPNAVNDTTAITVGEDSGLSATFNVLSNDLTTEGDAFSWISQSIGSVTGILTHSGSGVYRYNPNGQFESLDSGEQATTSFTYTIRENSYTTYTDTATATIRINGANDAPAAVNDGSTGFGNGHVSVNEGQSLTNAGNVDANDTDVDVEALTAFRTGAGVPANCDDVSPSQSLSFSLNSNGSFSYQHDGTNTLTGDQDSFSYCAYDGTAYSSPATVYIDIAPDNDPPVIINSAGNSAFTEQIATTIDSNVTLTDPENDNLDRAFVTISGGYSAGDNDTLACTVTSGLSCIYAAPTLTISGSASLATYETVLEGVQFSNTSDNPVLGNKTIDFSVRDINTATSLTDSKTVTVTRANDAPTLAAIAAQNAFEDTTADPFTFTFTAVASDIDVSDDVNDGGASTGGTPTLTYSLSGAPAGMTISSLSPNHGQISWNPPITGYPASVYGPITVLVEDGNEDGSAPAANGVSFSITVSPPDDDADMVENYNDVCLTVADPSNADNDLDGTPGSNGGANDGGDVCDLDDDNDGMPDSFEIANSLAPFDASDAAGDADGDGVTNLQEFLDGTSPNQSNLVIDATGYLTSYELVPPVPTSIHSEATAVTANDYGPYRPGDNTITWTPSNANDTDLATNDPGNLVSNPPEQPFFVRPLVSLAVDQQASENAVVMVTVSLNGDSPSWPANPATVTYKVSGTASNPQDHDATNGVLTFNDGEYVKTINFNTAPDGKQDPNETVVFTITKATNAAIGSQNTHKVTIVEGNVAPLVELQFSQGGDVLGSTYAGGGMITLDALVSDVNAAQTHSYDWSGTNNALLPPGNVASWMIAAPAAGNYLIDVRVTDSGNPAKSQRVTRILNVATGAAVALNGGDDTDMDGSNDAAEGYGDDDGDGIPNYLDAIDGLVSGANLVPDQTVDMEQSMLLQTESGLRLARGGTAQAASRFGALITDSEIRQFGSVNGDRPANPGDDQEHVGGVYDFEIRGLVPGESARIVIPLQSSVPRNAEFRKFHPASGWATFAEDNNNRIASAVGAPGACPEPGSRDYRDGLNYLDNCIELTIQDGGPNDTDGRKDGVVSDPSTIGVRLSDPEDEEIEDGGGRLSPLMLLTMLILAGGAYWRRRREGVSGA